MTTRFFLSDSGDVAFEAVWVDVGVLERLWPAQYSVPSWEGPPRDNWFMQPKTHQGLRVPLLALSASKDDDPVTFLNGRHRSRWMISQGHYEIPVGIASHQIALGKQMGLITRIAQPGDVLP